MLGLYVGQQTGSRVLNGEVYRGVGDIIEAVVLVCDMKGYTQLCSTRTAKETINLLNQFFEQICAPIEEAGGEVLKFMGDAVLAIFTPGVNPLPATCRSALKATRIAHKRLSETPLLLHGEEPIQVSAGFALHVGRFHYGNIGASNRLDFTAIGNAVNIASRVESKTRALGHDILCTRRFAELAGVTGKSLGLTPLKGMDEAQEIVGLQESE
jgi:adenylate cyclase